jgi:hypothetical protein
MTVRLANKSHVSVTYGTGGKTVAAVCNRRIVPYDEFVLHRENRRLQTRRYEAKQRQNASRMLALRRNS